jgi:hypothetical protein
MLRYRIAGKALEIEGFDLGQIADALGAAHCIGYTGDIKPR